MRRRRRRRHHTGDVDQLKGNAVGLYSILFLCVTGSAPLAVFIYNTPFTMPYGSGSNGPGDVRVRDDRAHDLLDRVRRDGQEGARRRRHVHVRQPRARPGLGRDGRLLADDRLRDLRRRPDRRLLARSRRRSSLQYGWHVNWLWLALIGVALVVCLAYFDVEISARVLGRRADQRDHDHPDRLDRLLRERARTSRSAPILPWNGLTTRGRAGRRPLLRVLVVGRLRGGAELRRGGQGSGPGHPDRADLLVRRRRPALHVHVVGARLGLRHGHRLGERRATAATRP